MKPLGVMINTLGIPVVIQCLFMYC